MRAVITSLTLSAVLLASGCAHLPPDEPSDPLETVNRGVYTFNRGADRYVLRPVAKTYRDYVPGPVRVGVGNFLDNLFYPTVIVNDLLQGKFAQGGRDLGRFVLNTTVGLVGVMDVATQVGLPANDEDFGQTLGYWGLGEGMYLMLPFLGPSNGRDLFGAVGDYFTSPTTYVEDTETQWIVTGVSAIDARTALLDADKFLDEQPDPYIFIRTAYLQQRQNLVFDGNPPRQKFDFDEDE
ncbi:MAG: MlaA family lipoprotein [Panacagrimonas sp.]